MSNIEPRLCYVEGDWAYFTTQPLDKQWGDDWDDAPYEHNAGEPYYPCWHNHPANINSPHRGLNPDTKEPLEPGELCRCPSCLEDWDEDGKAKWSVTKVAFDGDFEPPDFGLTNSRYSVQQINAGVVAWLKTGSWRAECQIVIPAGTTLDEFRQLIYAGGGKVYEERGE